MVTALLRVVSIGYDLGFLHTVLLTAIYSGRFHAVCKVIISHFAGMTVLPVIMFL